LKHWTEKLPTVKELDVMTEVRPRCRCQLNTCPHHPGDPGGCPRFATNLQDSLCAECRDAKIKALQNEIAEIDDEIEKTKIALVALQTGMSSEGDLEDEELIHLDSQRKKLASELEQSEKAKADKGQ
jgi:hypothetical protein